jgi:hypothetical protein
MQTLTLTEANEITFVAADSGPRKFDMEAYTGADVETMAGRMVVDLAGLQIGSQRKPALQQHDHSRIVGYSSEIENTGTSLRVRGNLSQRTAAAKEVTELADEGFPWQASIGFGIKAIEKIGKDKAVSVNGREFTGPITVLRKTVLKENSFVPLGADGATSAAVFSDDGSAPVVIPTQEPTMTIEQVTEFAADNKEAVLELDFIKAALAAEHDEAFKAGKAKGHDLATDRLNALKSMRGASAEFALEQYLAGHDTDKAGAILAEKHAVELEALRAENAKLKADGVQAPIALAAPEAVDSNDPEVIAKAEWQADPSLRTKFSNEARYVTVRKAELAGSLRVLTR